MALSAVRLGAAIIVSMCGVACFAGPLALAAAPAGPVCKGDHVAGTADVRAMLKRVEEAKMKAGAGPAIRLLFQSFSDSVDVIHNPASPGDGPKKGSIISDAEVREVAALQKAMPSDFTQGLDCMRMDHDVLEIVRTWGGTLKDESRFSWETTLRFTVSGDKIVRLEAVGTSDPIKRQQLMSIFQSGKS